MIGARLKQARLLAGMTQEQLARELTTSEYAITKQAISKYEREKSFPSARFWLTASDVLDVPSTYFSHQPLKRVEWLAFRCRSRLSKRERDRIKAYASDVAELQIELGELLFPNANPKMRVIPVKTLADAEDAAAQLRTEWDVGDRPLDNLAQTAEDRGIAVIAWRDDTGYFDGLSGRCRERPVAVVNTNVPLDRFRLSLAHEIGHLVMDVADAAEADEEKLAYRFAASLLVPADHAYRELGRNRPHIGWGELMSLKRKYGMSMAAWLMRARDLEIVTQNNHLEMWQDFGSRGWRRDEPEQYIGDEEPLQLKQMAQRAVAEGLISPDRIARVAIDILDEDNDLNRDGEYPTAGELLEMTQGERDMWMAKMFELAETLDIEVFEAFGEEEF